ncbi:MAG: hypothetical protein ACYTBZ_07585 [Planctomycetota bacterium]
MAKDRLGLILTFSVIATGLSIGALIGFWHLSWPVARGMPLVVHVSAGLCLSWGLASYFLKRYLPGFTAGSFGKELCVVLRWKTAALGLLAAVIMFYAAVCETLSRTVPYSMTEQLPTITWHSGFIDLGLLCLVLLLFWHPSGNGHLITILFWLLVSASLWGALRFHPLGEQCIGDRSGCITGWTFPLMLGSSLVLLTFTVLEGIISRNLRMNAWPEKLWRLTTPGPSWPGFHYSAGVWAVMVLIAGCINITNPWTSLAGFGVGASMLVLTSRRWNENLADIGLALVTLGAVSMLMFKIPTPRSGSTSFPIVYTRALTGLAIMTFCWFWLARVWNQQLDKGKAWTTAGRLIRVSQRVGFIIGTTGVLLSFHLLIWPKLPFVYDGDSSPWRLFWGLFSNSLLILAIFCAVKWTGKSTLAWLILFTITSTFGFLLVRTPNSIISQWFALNWPIATSVMALLFIIVNLLTARTNNWRAFAEPLYLAGMFVAPMIAIAGITLIEQLKIPPRVPSVTYGMLTCVYLLTAFAVGPRSLAAVAVICVIMTFWNLQELLGSTIIPLPCFYGILVGVVTCVMAFVFQHRARPGIIGFLKWAGFVLVLIFVVASIIVSHS